MNPFNKLLNDTVFVEDPNGSRSGPYKTAIGKKNGLSASIFEENLDVEEGWKLIRPLPNGKEESYTILEANFNPGIQSIPSFWELMLRKDSSLLNNPEVQKTTTVNISNSQGIQVGDHNVQHIAGSLIGLIESIETSGALASEKENAKGLLRELMSNPVVAGILGGATSGILALLG
jgi:hypothetical protein